ncbi:MAG: sigma-70 family RNA polymerase sigma factor [Planctomycetaceae bacterium]|nr:sigma-70 family RNA polymerase sigma factor [Planctomycetaceae bacterium]
MVTSSATNIEPLDDPDVMLMIAVGNDDAYAFEEIVQRYQSRLFGILRHLIGDIDLAEDLTQEVFLRVYRYRKQYQPGSKFSSWIFTIANNVALNAIRTKRRHPESQFAESRNNSSDSTWSVADIIQAASSTIPARALDKLEMKEMVKLAIESLNERQRMAVLLNKFEGMSYDEIANVMQMTQQGVKSLLCRARMNLKELLQPYLDNGLIPK